jgi:hypothetical protein
MSPLSCVFDSKCGALHIISFFMYFVATLGDLFLHCFWLAIVPICSFALVFFHFMCLLYVDQHIPSLCFLLVHVLIYFVFITFSCFLFPSYRFWRIGGKDQRSIGIKFHCFLLPSSKVQTTFVFLCFKCEILNLLVFFFPLCLTILINLFLCAFSLCLCQFTSSSFWLVLVLIWFIVTTLALARDQGKGVARLQAYK